MIPLATAAPHIEQKGEEISIMATVVYRPRDKGISFLFPARRKSRSQLTVPRYVSTVPHRTYDRGDEGASMHIQGSPEDLFSTNVVRV